MASMPVPVNNNLNRATNQLPIAGNQNAQPEKLGGIVADGTTITVDQTTGIASVAAGGGGVSGTPGFIPKFATASTLGNSTIDQGVTTPGVVTVAEKTSVQAHSAFGVGSQIDNNPNDGAVPIALNVSEDSVGTVPSIVLAAYRNWTPATDADAGAYMSAASFSAYLNADAQATDDLQIVGLSVYAENDSNTRNASSVIGASISADLNGAASTQHLFGVQGAVYASVVGATVSEDAIAMLATIQAGHGHLVNVVNFYADPLVLQNDTLVDSWRGLHVHAPINTSSHPIGAATGVQIDVDSNHGTVARAISSTGTALSDFAGPVAVPTLRAHTVYVTGTLPSAVTEGVGARAFVSDAVGNTFNLAYVGGGANKVPVFSDGAIWRIG